MNSDFRELLQILNEQEVRYLVAGGYAVIHHTQPRYTKDIDIWIEPTKENAHKLMEAFRLFGVPLLGRVEDDFAQEGSQLSLGARPSEIDFLTTIPGLEFDPAWERRVISDEDGLEIPYLGRSDIISAKKKAGRPQDLVDLEELSLAGDDDVEGAT